MPTRKKTVLTKEQWTARRKQAAGKKIRATVSNKGKAQFRYVTENPITRGKGKAIDGSLKDAVAQHADWNKQAEREIKKRDRKDAYKAAGDKAKAKAKSALGKVGRGAAKVAASRALPHVAAAVAGTALAYKEGKKSVAKARQRRKDDISGKNPVRERPAKGMAKKPRAR